MPYIRGENYPDADGIVNKMGMKCILVRGLLVTIHCDWEDMVLILYFNMVKS